MRVRRLLLTSSATIKNLRVTRQGHCCGLTAVGPEARASPAYIDGSSLLMLPNHPAPLPGAPREAQAERAHAMPHWPQHVRRVRYRQPRRDMQPPCPVKRHPASRRRATGAQPTLSRSPHRGAPPQIPRLPHRPTGPHHTRLQPRCGSVSGASERLRRAPQHGTRSPLRPGPRLPTKVAPPGLSSWSRNATVQGSVPPLTCPRVSASVRLLRSRSRRRVTPASHAPLAPPSPSPLRRPQRLLEAPTRLPLPARPR